MSDRSKRAYDWIDIKTKRMGQWIDRAVKKQWFRILILIMAASISAIGYQQSEGTFLRSVSPELFGIVITAVLIDAVNEWRQERERKQILIAQLGSERRDVTELAVIELRNREWLYDGSLTKVNIRKANLDNADLFKADLGEVDLTNAKLNGASLEGANLGRAILMGAELVQANLKQARLNGARLDRAVMDGTDLTGAWLKDANLEEVSLIVKNVCGYDVPTVLNGAHLEGASLVEARLAGAFLSLAHLDGADLLWVNLDNADLTGACLRGVRNWTIDQLDQAGSKAGATMPDGEQLGSNETSGPLAYQCVKGRNFEEWRGGYLASNGGTVADVRDPKN